MTNVPSCTSARQPKSYSTPFQFSALWLVSTVVINGVTGLDLAWTVVILIVVLVVTVPGVRREGGIPPRVRLGAGDCLSS